MNKQTRRIAILPGGGNEANGLVVKHYIASDFEKVGLNYLSLLSLPGRGMSI